MALLLLGRELGGLAAALGLTLAYPLALLALGFFLPEERRTLLARQPAMRPVTYMIAIPARKPATAIPERSPAGSRRCT